jgi:Helix-turn-helix domain
MSTVPTNNGNGNGRRKFMQIDRELAEVLPPYPWKVYCVLKAHENAQQESWPSEQTMARESLCSVRQVSRAKATLKEVGLVSTRWKLIHPTDQLPSLVYTLLEVTEAIIKRLRVAQTRTASQAGPPCHTGVTLTPNRRDPPACEADRTIPIEREPVNETQLNETRTLPPVAAPPPGVAAPPPEARRAATTDGCAAPHQTPLLLSERRPPTREIPAEVVTMLSQAQVIEAEQFDTFLRERTEDGARAEDVIARYPNKSGLWRQWRDSFTRKTA